MDHEDAKVRENAKREDREGVWITKARKFAKTRSAKIAKVFGSRRREGSRKREARRCLDHEGAKGREARRCLDHEDAKVRENAKREERE